MRASEKQGLSPVVPGACFIAGTLVHTDQGLVPIENIKVGDRVLTQPEETRERIYKSVVKAFKFDDTPVWAVEYVLKAEREQALVEGYMMRPDCECRLVVTPDHPFWVKGEGLHPYSGKVQGWVQARDLEVEYELELCDGQTAIISRVSSLYHSETEGIAWQEGVFLPEDGWRIDLQNGKSGERDFPQGRLERFSQPKFIELREESSCFRCSVYNFEVEDCHTYYVGTAGVWVHNLGCGQVQSQLAFRENAKYL